jgi:hypothetical protein
MEAPAGVAPSLEMTSERAYYFSLVRGGLRSPPRRFINPLEILSFLFYL